MLFLLIRRGLRQHLVSTAVAVLLVALGMGLVVSVWVVRAQAEQSFTRSASGFDAVLGRPSAIAWSSDRGHFSSPWITEVEQTAARVRHSVRLAATLKPQQRPR